MTHNTRMHYDQQVTASVQSRHRSLISIYVLSCALLAKCLCNILYLPLAGTHNINKWSILNSNIDCIRVICRTTFIVSDTVTSLTEPLQQLRTLLAYNWQDVPRSIRSAACVRQRLLLVRFLMWPSLGGLHKALHLSVVCLSVLCLRFTRNWKKSAEPLSLAVVVVGVVSGRHRLIS